MTSYPLDAVIQKLSDIAPLRLAESWDNVGLLLGNRGTYVDRVMTCLTITPEVVQEAITKQVNLVVAHHPLPFKPMARVTSDSVTGKMVLDLISRHVAVYSAHTAYDSAALGINAQWAAGLDLASPAPLQPQENANSPADKLLGGGRYGRLPEPLTLEALAAKAALICGAPRCRMVASDAAGELITKVAVACGSGGSFLSAAVRRGCDALITGEATFHVCLEARASGVSLILTGHFFSERFAMVELARVLSVELNGLNVFASESDVDPFQDPI